MQHEKIIKRSDGSEVKICVYFLYDSGRDKAYWTYVVHTRAPGKKEFIYQGSDEWVTPEEILQAKLELWEKIKPTT